MHFKMLSISAVLAVLVFGYVEPSNAAGIWALCRGRSHCLTNENLSLLCPSVGSVTGSLSVVHVEIEDGRLLISRQWAMPSWMNHSHVKIGREKFHQLSRIGSELLVNRGLSCVAIEMQPWQQPQLVRQFGPFCRQRIRRGRVNCRRPRGCDKHQPCAVPEDPFSSDLCEFTAATCKECCPDMECKEIDCYNPTASFSETKESFNEAMKFYRERCPDCRELSHRAVETVPSIAGVVYTSYTTTYVPQGQYVSFYDAQHEIAHSLRYDCNGDKELYRLDAARYEYLRSHSCNRKAGKEFSFNEGWAFFWAEECYDSTGSMEDVAGNVANMLRSLKEKCASSLSDMTRVLCRNPGKIYSFADFKNYHQQMYGCS